MKDNWGYKKLGETYNFIDYRGMTPNKIDEGIPLITAKNVRMGYIDYSIKDFISEEDYQKRQTRGVAHKGDILFTTEAPLGYSALADLDVFSTGQRIITFQQFDNEQSLYNPFYNYYFQSSEFQKLIKENATGLTATGIKASRLREISVPLPPLSEQKRIVKILDEKFAQLEIVKANAKANLQNAKDLFQSQLTKAFSNTTWEKKRLGECCKIIGGGTPSKKNQKYYEGFIPWASVRDMSQDILDSTEFCITKDAVKDSSTNIIPKGNIIIATRVGLGKVCILQQDTAINQDLKGVLPNNDKNLNRIYLFWFFKSIADFIISNGVGATVHGVKLDFVQNLEIPLPPLPEQKRIVEQLDSLSEKVRSLEEIYTKQLANCDELKQAFLAKAFNGEL